MKPITKVYLGFLGLASFGAFCMLTELHHFEAGLSAFLLGVGLVYATLIGLYLTPPSLEKKIPLIVLNLITFLSGIFYSGGIIILFIGFSKYIDFGIFLIALIPFSLTTLFTVFSGIHTYKALNLVESGPNKDENTF